MTAARKTLAILFAAFAALMLWMTLTVPIIAAAAPAILLIGSAAGAWLAWPKHREPRSS
jgi:hypothetical protein